MPISSRASEASAGHEAEHKPDMQHNRRQQVHNSSTKGVKAQEAPAATPKKEAPRAGSVPPKAELHQPHHDTPFGPVSPHTTRQTANQRKTLGPGEKQALTGGLFVMFSLAVALAVGWWVTPAAPPSFSATDMHTREARPAVLPPDINESERNSYGSSGRTDSVMDVETAPVEEVSVLPPGPDKSSAPAQKKKVNEPKAPAAETRPSPATKANTDSAKDAERESEVQRLKAQAYSETRKDRLGRIPPTDAAPDTSDGKPQPSPTRDRAAQSKSTDLSQAVAKCDNEDGLFYRERCKWRLCNGRWGKYGCPSFENDTRATWQVGGLKRYGKPATHNKKARRVSLSRFVRIS